MLGTTTIALPFGCNCCLANLSSETSSGMCSNTWVYITRSNFLAPWPTSAEETNSDKVPQKLSAFLMLANFLASSSKNFLLGSTDTRCVATSEMAWLKDPEPAPTSRMLPSRLFPRYLISEPAVLASAHTITSCSCSPNSFSVTAPIPNWKSSLWRRLIIVERDPIAQSCAAVSAILANFIFDSPAQRGRNLIGTSEIFKPLDAAQAITPPKNAYPLKSMTSRIVFSKAVRP